MIPLFDPAELEREATRRGALGCLPAWWAALPDGPASRDLPVGKCLYDSPTRGFALRTAELELWCRAYDSFGSFRRSHAWHPSGAHFGGRDPDSVTAYQLDRHEPVRLACDLRRDWIHREERYEPVPPCGHGKDAEALRAAGSWQGLLYRCACRKAGCDWEGPERGRENPAVEDGLDHAWPGWRDLPTVPRLPEGAKVYDVASTPRQSAAHKTFANWVAKINAVYPAGWLEGGGPIRTLRRPLETRHVENATPYGGYDLGVPSEAQ
jgi:uncharacterized protein DUF6349